MGKLRSNIKRGALGALTTVFCSTTLAAFSVLPAHAYTTYQNDVISDSASGYWTLSSDQYHAGQALADQVAVNDMGSLYVTYGNTAINTGESYSAYFDGSTAYARQDTNSVNSPSSNFSVEAWIKPSSIPSTYNYAGIAIKNGSYGLFFDGPELAFFTKQSGVYRVCDDTTDTISTGSIYHLVGTYDGSNEKLYVNGSLVCTLSETGNIDTNASALVLGSWDTSDLFYNGYMSDVAVYDSVLTSTQASTHYSDGI